MDSLALVVQFLGPGTGPCRFHRFIVSSSTRDQKSWIDFDTELVCVSLVCICIQGFVGRQFGESPDSSHSSCSPGTSSGVSCRCHVLSMTVNDEDMRCSATSK
ncbi:hypothetical protein VFPPC_15830 [Pochonia chlamydosporia 170]|uniref:Uncharacterized protein n=1 Tax=Pochonia chlamydosporia 170 TaxID=1380566 RepID=A0A179FS83_METCM|nr:hypothetical protein VFPPC_15830 [Pochonia chlamydosporia 170]OAQ68472.2 hypothetical protein VFPPC_15830 [Pochonia chlamydosporia 170]